MSLRKGFNALTFTLCAILGLLNLSINAQTYNFSNAGANGRFGPTQAQVNATYTGTNTLSGNVTVNTQGIQEWTIPTTGNYKIEAYGAQGGRVDDGKGAYLKGEFSFTAGTVLKVLVGQNGTEDRYALSGGGGSFVSQSNNTPILVAGGGGGWRNSSEGTRPQTTDGTVANNGNSGYYNNASLNNGGTNGNGGITTFTSTHGGGGGAGFYGDGDASNDNRGGTPIAPLAFVNGGVGGYTPSNYFGPGAEEGGFGGGAAGGWGGAGAGGGYSGGGADYNSGWSGGGGSYNSGTNQINTGGTNTGMGSVVITLLCTPTVVASISCPSNMSVNTDAGKCDAVVTFSTPVGTDDCGNTTTVQTEGLSSGSSFPIGTTTNSYSTTNDLGTSTCSFTVTVEDNIAPVLICGDITVYLDSEGNVGNNPYLNGALISESDNCSTVGGVGVTGPKTYTCDKVGTHNVTVIQDDPSGNEGRCTYAITVVDSTAPTAVCQNIVVQLDVTGNATITVDDIDNGSSDNCEIASMSIDTDAFTCDNVGDNTVTLTVTDVNGNISTCTSTVTIENNNVPVAVCKNFTVELDDNGNASITTNDIDDGSSATCGIASLAVSPSTFSCDNVGANTVTLTVTDVNGNISTCTSTVTVEDNIAPVLICGDVTVYLNSEGNVGNNPYLNGALISESDNCSTVGGVGVTGPKTYTCDKVGTHNVTVIQDDPSGNEGRCTYAITVVDSTAPTVVCQNIVVQLDATGNASITAADVDNGSSDNCGISMSIDNSTFTCNNVGANTVTLTVTDPSGNVSTCTSTVTIENNNAPIALCKDLTVELDDNGNASITTNDIDDGSSATCAIASLAVSPSTFSCDNVGANTVTLTVTDVNGNSSACTSTVTVEDNIAPVLICGDVTVYLNSEGNVGNNPYLNGALISESDNCSTVGGVGVTGPRTYTCDKVGTHNVTVIQDDPSGNEGRCTYAITVVDSTAPTAVCQNIVVQLDATGNATITADDIDNGSSDVCGITTTIDISEFNCDNIGANPVTLTVTDPSGNVATCSSTVTVENNNAPIAICKDLTVELDANGNATITTNDIDDGSSATCGIASLAVSPSTFTCDNIGANTVTLTVTDVNGNISTCTSTVSVEDNILPTIVCKDVSIYLNATGTAPFNVFSTGAVVSRSDNCQTKGSVGVTGPQSYNCSQAGDHNIRIYQQDLSGNQSSCTMTLTVIDDIAPSAICQNLTVQLDATGNATITADDIDNGSSDNCEIASLTIDQSTFSCAETVVQSSIYFDGQADKVTVPANSVLNFTEGTIEAWVKPGAANQNRAVMSMRSTVSNTRWSIHLNENSNTIGLWNGSAYVNFSYNFVPDTWYHIAVSFTNSGTIFYINGTYVYTVSTLMNSAVTNTPLTIGSTNDPGYAHEDFVGEMDEIRVWNVVRTPAEIMSSKDNGLTGNENGLITYLPFNENTGTTTSDHSPNGFTADISGAVWNIQNSPVNSSPLVTLTVTDESGNVSSCTSIVTVEDNIAPTAICQNLTIELNSTGNASITADDVDNGSSDACGIASLSIDKTDFTCDNIGTNNITLTVTDVNGNVSTCSSIITIEDNIAPTITCKDVSIYLNATGIAPFNVFSTGAVVSRSDNCQTKGSVGVTGPQSYNCSQAGDHNIRIYQQDLSGNQSSCTMTLTVIDDIAPSAVCQNLTVQLDATGNATITADDINDGSSDNCEIASLSIDKTDFSCTDVGANTVSLTVTDESGNVATCSSTVTVENNNAPIAICKDLTVELDANGNASITSSDIDDGSSASCDIASLAVSPNTFTCDNVGANTVTLTVTDVNGNVSTCSSTVTVEDNVAPTAVCKDIIVQLDASGNASITAADVDNGSSDACGIASMSVSPSTFNCSQEGAIHAVPVTLTVTDVNGNVSTCTANVEVDDKILPTAVCKNITVTLDANGEASIIPSDVDGGSSDNCGWTKPLSVTPSNFGCTNVGNNSVILRVGDGNGNQNTCTAIVTVEDNIAPTVVCNNITINLFDRDIYSLTQADIDQIALGSFDNCDNITSTITAGQTNFDCDDKNQDFEITLTVTDASGNASSCNATISITDTESVCNDPPVAACKNITIFTGETCTASIIPTDIDGGSSDPDGDVLTYVVDNQGPFAVGTHIVTLIVSDYEYSDTCTAIVTVEDKTAPIAVCHDIIVQLDASGNASITAADIDNSSSDACGIAGLSVSPSTFKCAEVGANTVTLTVTDNNGNVSTCTSTITVEDNVNPIATCQDLTVQLDANGQGAITPGQVNNGSSDACGIASLSVSPSTFTCAEVGANTVTLTVTDNNGNVSTCTSTITVEDNVNPIATCQDLTVQLDANGQGAITPGQVNNGSSDACGIASLSLNEVNFDCAEVGANTVVLSVTDVNGNVSTCTSTITVVDTVNPIAICQDLTVQLDANGNVSITAGDVDNGSSDACGIATMTLDNYAFGCDNIGDNTVILTVTDNNNNITTCTSTITVEGIIPVVSISESVMPAFCQGAVVLLTADSDEAVYYSWSTAESTKMIEAGADGVYTTTVTSATGCTASAEYTVSGFDAGSLISSYTIIGFEEVHLHDDNAVNTGSVGVTDDRKKAKIHNNSTVTDFVQAPRVEIRNGSTVNNVIQAQANVTLPTFIYNTYSDRSSQDVRIRDNQTDTLTGTVYGKVEVGKNASVVFTASNIYLDELKTKDGVSIEFTGCANIYMNKHLHLKKGTTFNQNGHTVIVYVDGHVDVKERSYVRAKLYANNDHIDVHGKKNAPTTMVGQFIGKKIHGHENVVWEWDRYCSPCETEVPSEDEIACGPCAGGIVELTLEYNGNIGADILVETKKGDVLYSGYHTPGESFTFVGTEKGNKMSSEISLYVNNQRNTKIHVSCSRPIYVGDENGAFTVLAGQSKNNGPICADLLSSIFSPLFRSTDEEENTEVEMVSELKIKAFPNPFTETATIQFVSGKDDFVTIKLYTLTGVELSTLYSNNVEANQTVDILLDGINLEPGIYVYTLQTDSGQLITNRIVKAE